jgi:hypothetical protein
MPSRRRSAGRRPDDGETARAPVPDPAQDLTLVNRASTYAHNDPALGDPKKDAFVKRAVAVPEVGARKLATMPDLDEEIDALRPPAGSSSPSGTRWPSACGRTTPRRCGPGQGAAQAVVSRRGRQPGPVAASRRSGKRCSMAGDALRGGAGGSPCRCAATRLRRGAGEAERRAVGDSGHRRARARPCGRVPIRHVLAASARASTPPPPTTRRAPRSRRRA